MRLRSLFLSALVLAFVPAAVHAQIATSADTGRTLISASGQARATVVPDRATLTLLVEPQAMSVEEAGSRLASVERAVLDTLRRFNLPTGAIQTMNSGVTPYRSNMNPSAGPSFSGRSSIRIELTRLDVIPAITGAALAKGATFVSPASFTSSTTDSVRRALLPQAFQQARREAEALAMAAGGRLGRLIDLSATPVSINYNDQIQNVIVSGMMFDNGQRLAPVTTVQASVTTRWLFIPGGH